MRRIVLQIFFIASCSIATCVSARDNLRFLVPATPYFNPPIGIVYASSVSVGGINPASMLYLQKAWGISMSNSIPFGNAGDYGLAASVSHTGRPVSLSAGYLGTVGNTNSHGYYGGVGFKYKKTDMGIVAMKVPGPVGAHRFDMGIMLPILRKMAFAAKIENITTGPQPVIGGGFQGSTSNFELNIRLPPVTAMDGGYQIIAASQYVRRRFNYQASFSYETVQRVTAFALGLGFSLSNDINLSAQYSSNSRLTLGLAFEL